MQINKKILGITENITLIHFLVMFGYKLFSLYFPLFLIQKNFSIIEIGYTNFLIYLSIAVSAPLVGYLNHKIKPYILISLGVLGYGVYSFLMITSISFFWFYLSQILLGISAALFFVSSRNILMGTNQKKADGAFAWFYSAPSYADAIAPVLGALIIWKFGFFGVFGVALIIQLIASFYAYFSLKGKPLGIMEDVSLKTSALKYKEIRNSMKLKGAGIFIFISFLVLIIAGFNNTFFILFLKSLNWTQDQILIFNSLVSLAFLPISFVIAKRINKSSSEQNICLGSSAVGLFSILLGGLANILNFYSVFIISLSQSVGGLITSSGRSGLMSAKLKKYKEESAAIDTIFSPLSTAFGALLGGFLIASFDYSFIFMTGGLIILFFSLTGQYFFRKRSLR
ncbi:MAG: MFS transporter [Candidatus Paceibacterota bacterium]|jgi:MFS family permease|nr:MFS transporter [bacterium]